jgi:hypothetical protein
MVTPSFIKSDKRSKPGSSLPIQDPNDHGAVRIIVVFFSQDRKRSDRVCLVKWQAGKRKMFPFSNYF